jgi:hypothetical protein
MEENMQTTENNAIVKRTEYGMQDLITMSNAVAKSGLFGTKTPEQALALMLVAQAEGLHPATAARDYHIIEGKPSLKADAMLARFQGAGGVVSWEELTDKRVAAYFSHPTGSPKPVLVEWTMEMAKRAGLAGKATWQKFPRQMMRSRVVSEGIRTVYPANIVSTYTPEELMDEPRNVTEGVTVEPPTGATRTAGLVDKLKGKPEPVEATIVEPTPVPPKAEPKPEPEEEKPTLTPDQEAEAMGMKTPEPPSEPEHKPTKADFKQAKDNVIQLIGKYAVPGATAQAICEQATKKQYSKDWNTLEDCTKAYEAITTYIRANGLKPVEPPNA